MPSGQVSGLYYPKCSPDSPDSQGAEGQFNMCMFRSKQNLQVIPRIGDAVAMKQLSYVGQGLLPVVDMHALTDPGFRGHQYVPRTPDANYVWGTVGHLRTVGHIQGRELQPVHLL